MTGTYSDGVNYTSVVSAASQQATSAAINTVTNIACNISYFTPTGYLTYPTNYVGCVWTYTASSQTLLNMTITMCQNSGMTNNCTTTVTTNSTLADITTLGYNSANW